MLQHDIDIISVGNETIDISIFDNNTFNFIKPKNNGNQVVIFKNLPVRYKEGFKLIGDETNIKNTKLRGFHFSQEIDKDYRPIALSAGESDLIKANNSVMIEESNFGRLVEVDLENKEILWQYVNKKTANALPFLLNWSRRYRNIAF